MRENALIFAVANQKGGVGKTTTAVNLAASFAVSERRTLLVDLDPQGNASSAFGIREARPHIYDGLCRDVPADQLIHASELPTLKIIPSGKDLVGAEVELVAEIAREGRLAALLEPLGTRFDLVLVDCPPSLGLLTLNALTAADRILVPLQAEYYALEGLAHLLETVERVRKALNPKLTLEAIILTMFDSRVNLGHQVAAEVRKHFGARVLETAVPRNVRLSEAPSFGKPALLYDARSAGARAYLEIAAELLERVDSNKRSEAGLRPASHTERDAGDSALQNASMTREPPASEVSRRAASVVPQRLAPEERGDGHPVASGGGSDDRPT